MQTVETERGGSPGCSENKQNRKALLIKTNEHNFAVRSD